MKMACHGLVVCLCKSLLSYMSTLHEPLGGTPQPNRNASTLKWGKIIREGSCHKSYYSHKGSFKQLAS